MRFALLPLALLLATPASAFIAQNGKSVQGDAPGGFTVSWSGQSGPSQFWCAAGDYAVRSLHVPPATKIYRTSEPPRRAGESVSFSLDASLAASSTGLAFFRPQGAGMSASFAQSFCEERFKHR